MTLPKSLPLIHNPPGSPRPDGTTDPIPKLCSQRTVMVPPNVFAGLRQKHRFGTPEWRRSYDRRNKVESDFGVLQNMATQAAKHGRTQVRGRAKSMLLLTMSAMATNRRLIAAWRDNIEGKGPAVTTAQKQQLPAAIAAMVTEAPTVRTRAKRRTSTLSTLIGTRGHSRPKQRARAPG
jgi:hypothetical protein